MFFCGDCDVKPDEEFAELGEGRGLRVIEPSPTGTGVVFPALRIE
jgi:hypothetical protein